MEMNLSQRHLSIEIIINKDKDIKTVGLGKVETVIEETPIVTDDRTNDRTDDKDETMTLDNFMSDVNDDAKHIESVEKFLQVCVERILDKNEKTNDKLYIIASAINMIKEFIIAESRYSRIHMNEINKLLSKVKITQDLNG